MLVGEITDILQQMYQHTLVNILEKNVKDMAMEGRHGKFFMIRELQRKNVWAIHTQVLRVFEKFPVLLQKSVVDMP